MCYNIDSNIWIISKNDTFFCKYMSKPYGYWCRTISLYPHLGVAMRMLYVCACACARDNKKNRKRKHFTVFLTNKKKLKKVGYLVIIFRDLVFYILSTDLKEGHSDEEYIYNN